MHFEFGVFTVEELYEEYRAKEPPERPHIITGGTLFCKFLNRSVKASTAAARKAIVNHYISWHFDKKDQSTINKHLNKLKSDVTKHRAHAADRKRSWDDLCATLAEEFVFTASPKVSVHPSPDSPSTPPDTAFTSHPPPVSSSSPPHTSSSPPQHTSSSPPVLVESPPPVTPQPRRLRSDCLSCHRKRLALSASRKKRQEERKTVRAARKLNTENVDLSRRNETLTSKFVIAEQKRQDAVKEKKKAQRRERDFKKKVLTETEKDALIVAQQQDIRKLKSKVGYWRRKYFKKSELCDCDGQIIDLTNKNASLTYEINKLTAHIEDLENQLEDIVEQEEDDCDSVKTKRFSDSVRKVIYKTLMCNVPVEKTKELCEYIVQTTTAQVVSFPGKSTTAILAYEMSAISTLQAAQGIHRAKWATLCWDATTDDTSLKHMNEFHISTDLGETFTIAIDLTAGGKAVDYADHIVAALNELITAYADFLSMPQHEIKDIFLQRFKSALSDRCPTNPAVVARLEDQLEIELFELYCNLHCVVGFATYSLKHLMELDKTMGLDKIMVSSKTKKETYTRAEKFIHGVSKIRYFL